MSYRTELTSLETLASTLPFDLDQSDRVNEAFVAYMEDRLSQHKTLIDLWTYCYVRRYFLIKFIRERTFQVSELDQVVEQAYRKVDSSRSLIAHHDRYAQWVSVVCRNTYMNFVSRRQALTSLLPSHDFPLPPKVGSDLDVNAGAIHEALRRAIQELPEFLQSTARMRFVENLTYEEISRIVGKRIPTIRSYIHKICQRFRKDRQLMAWAERLLEP